MLFADCFHGAAHNMLGDVGLELMNVVSSDSDNALNSVLSVFDSSPIELWTDWRERIIMCVRIRAQLCILDGMFCDYENGRN